MLFCVCARYSVTYLLYVLAEPPCPHLHTNRENTRIGNEVEDVTPSSPTNDNRIFYIWNSIVYTEYSIYADDYVIHVSGDASDASTKWKVRIRTGSSNDLCTDNINTIEMMWGGQILWMHKNDMAAWPIRSVDDPTEMTMSEFGNGFLFTRSSVMFTQVKRREENVNASHNFRWAVRWHKMIWSDFGWIPQFRHVAGIYEENMRKPIDIVSFSHAESMIHTFSGRKSESVPVGIVFIRLSFWSYK